MAGRTLVRSLALALALAALTGSASAEPLRYTQPKPLHTPITLLADEVTVWNDRGRRVVALSGKVFAEQGVTQLNAEHAIAWVETPDPTQGRSARVIVYAEGSVSLDSSGTTRQGETAVIELATDRDVNLKAAASKIAQRSLADTDLYRRAAAAARGDNAEPQFGSARNMDEAPKTDPSVKPAQFTNPAGPPELPPPESTPYRQLPAGPPSVEAPGPRPAPKLEPTTEIPLPSAPQRSLIIAQRSLTPWQAKYDVINGEEVLVITNGVKLLARIHQQNALFTLDVEADRLIVWRRGGGGSSDNLLRSLQSGTNQGDKSEIELYLAGNVVIRYGSDREKRTADGTLQEQKTLRAEQVYYDVGRNKAIAVQADLELSRAGLPQPAHFRGDEIWQLSPQEWRSIRASANASKLPSDPGVQVRLSEATILEEKEVRRTIFGLPYFNRETGAVTPETERTFQGRNVSVELGGVPVLWLPYLAGNVEDPFGPLQAVRFRSDRVFGPSGFVTWDIFDLIGTHPLPGERWQLFTDYMGKRGPALGTEYDYSGRKIFDIDAPYRGFFKAYGIYDYGHDILGGLRDLEFQPPALRGRVTWRHMQDFDDWQYQGQISALADPRFYEQYYKYEFDLGPNQETFGYLKWQQGNLAANALIEPGFNRFWVTETQWLPRVDGWLIGESFFDRLTYSTWASAGYARLRTAEIPPFPVTPTDVATDTARFDIMQELSAPFQLGALKLVPYGKLDLAYYSNDLNGDQRGRVYGGAGARASLPLSRLYPGVESELFNLNGLYHKITFGANYYTAWTDAEYSLFPQLDRLDDDATDQARNGITPIQPLLVPGPKGIALRDSPLFDPQTYAIRRLVDWRPETLNTIQVVQADISQRWQTKRGYPGMEHTVDWLTLDVSASFFPAPNRDNFGETVSFIEYNSTWAAGDRTGLVTTGWFDPFDVGTRYWTVGTYLDRPDRTHFYLGYRQFDPVRSKAVIASVGYVFSPKYAITASTVYDFGIAEALSNQLVLTRIGTDLQVSIGVSYNALINNFGFTFEIVPNLAGNRTRLFSQGSSVFQGR